MTKKQYTAPVTTVVDIHVDSLLTDASKNGLPIDKENEEEPVTDPNYVYSRRRRNTWDDEEEDYDF